MKTPLEMEPAHEEHREALRRPAKQPGVVIGIEHPESGRHEGVLLDVSRAGLRLRSKARLPCGDVVLLHPPDGEGLRPGQARIMRERVCRHEGETQFDYGLQFTDRAEVRRHAWFLLMRAA